MAIKQRKQLTGTTAQINAYAGVEGQLVWDKTKKKWVGMSGTAGTNYPMASESHTHSISNVTNLQSTLDGKQPKGDYATATALSTGLAGKANKAHTHAVADVTNLQTTLDDKIPKTGNRGMPAGYSQITEGTTQVTRDTPDSSIGIAGDIVVLSVVNGSDDETWTKVVSIGKGSVSLGDRWHWVDGEVPELTYPCYLICHWNGGDGIVGIVKGAS